VTPRHRILGFAISKSPTPQQTRPHLPAVIHVRDRKHSTGFGVPCQHCFQIRVLSDRKLTLGEPKSGRESGVPFIPEQIAKGLQDYVKQRNLASEDRLSPICCSTARGIPNGPKGFGGCIHTSESVLEDVFNKMSDDFLFDYFRNSRKFSCFFFFLTYESLFCTFSSPKRSSCQMNNPLERYAIRDML
jgi:hypothetical protein